MRFITVGTETRRRVILVASLVLLLLVVRWSTPVFRGEIHPAAGRTGAIDRVAVSGEVAALTFNVTWGSKTFQEVLDELQAAGVHATFFAAGPWMQGHPDLLRRAIDEGHDVGSLGHRQIDLTSADRGTVQEELDAAARAMERAVDSRPELFRPPGGYCDGEVSGLAMEMGMTTILATLDAEDWTNPGPEEIAERVVENIQPGYIVEFHADDSSRQVADALPILIEKLHREGYQLVPVTRLLGSD